MVYCFPNCLKLVNNPSTYPVASRAVILAFILGGEYYVVS